MIRKSTFILLILMGVVVKGYSQNLFITADRDCRFFIDGIIEGQLKSGEKYETTVPGGVHTIIAKTLDGKLNFRKQFTIETETIMLISFDEQIEHIKKEKQKREERNRKIAFYKTQKQNIISEINENMVFLEGGKFSRGSTEGDEDEQPVRKISVNSFYIGKYEVTQKQWMAVMEDNPSHFHDCENCPVENVNWYDAIVFCNNLSRLSGLTPYYAIDSARTDKNNQNFYDHMKWTITIQENANGYRLPTEAEWEYAAANRTDYLFAGSSDAGEVAWTLNNAYGTSHPAGQKKPNTNGLYDMSGNVWEWCYDWYAHDYYSQGRNDNPLGPEKGQLRVIRGGGWMSHAEHALVRNRDRDGADNKNSFTGFRLVRNK